MSSENSMEVEPQTVEVVFEADVESSEDPPMEEWSSLMFDVRVVENIKRTKFDQGLYHPGSGEICGKYDALSASSVFRHPYYNYPGVLDPGIKEALFNPLPKTIYSDDGQELYLAICKEMSECPIRTFYKQLLEGEIDLKYYGISLRGIRPIAMALKLNRHVQVLDLTDNWISEDGCFHLGQMLTENITLRELNLTGCRIGPNGARLLLNKLHVNRFLKVLNLSKNQLEDEGVEHLAKAISKGSDITDVNLSFNKLSGKAALNLAEVLEINNKLRSLNLSWNSMLAPNALFLLCSRLAGNNKFEELDLSWNALSGQRLANGIKNLMKNPNLRTLILSNNRLEGAAIKAIGTNLKQAKNLEVLDLSYNPLTFDDAIKILTWMKERQVKLKRLLLDNVVVDQSFMDLRDEILKLKFRKNAVITWGCLKPDFKPKGTDIREIIFNRADAICRAKKKGAVDIALVILELHRLSPEPWMTKEFFREVRRAGAALDDDLLTELSNIFAGPKAEKSTTINICAIVDYIKRKWPDRKLPPPPPPEPEVVVPEVKKKGKKK